jgi:hypothetical protein
MVDACAGTREAKHVSYAQNLLYQLFVTNACHRPMRGYFGTYECHSAGEILQ